MSMGHVHCRPLSFFLVVCVSEFSAQHGNYSRYFAQKGFNTQEQCASVSRRRGGAGYRLGSAPDSQNTACRSTRNYPSATTRKPPDSEHMLAQLQFRELKARCRGHCYHSSWSQSLESGSCCLWDHSWRFLWSWLPAENIPQTEGT